MSFNYFLNDAQSLEDEENKRIHLSTVQLSNHLNQTDMMVHTHFNQEQSQSSSQSKKKVSSKMEKSKKGIEEDNKNILHGRWSLDENKKYHWFLEINFPHFINRHMRRMDKIFKLMEIFLGTRQAEQCRSHHQKMQKKYHKFANILINLREQHYKTLNPQPIIAEIQENYIEMPSPLPTREELIMHQGSRSDELPSKLKKKKEEKSVNLERISEMEPSMLEIDEGEEKDEKCEEGEREDEYNPEVDMFADSNINLLYIQHEKYQNSEICNVFKQ